MHRGVIEEVLTPLLRQLSAAEDLSKRKKLSQLDPLLKKIKHDLQEMKSLFRHDDAKESKVIEQFEAVYQQVDDLLQSVRPVPDEMPHGVEDRGGNGIMEIKLKTIDQVITNIKENLLSFPPWPAKDGPTSEESPSAAMEDQATPDKGKEVQWEKIFKGSEAMSHLSSRIENLDGQLKGCLFSFTAFRENEVVKKRLLIHWWIGEGLVADTPSSSGSTAEENGELCVKELISKHLIEPSYRKWSSEVVGCKMYEWIYRLLMLAPMRIAYSSPSCRVCFETNEELYSTGSDQERVLTLYNIGNKYLRFKNDWFTGKKCLKVVQLGRWQDSPRYHIEVENSDFLHWLVQCTNLKYLSLRGISRITKLPDSIGKLTNLIILDLRACHNLEKLTGAITSLKNLTHLDVSECYLLEQMPKGLGSLSKLRVLKGFVIGNARSKKRRSTGPCSLTELAKSENLRKLSITIGRNSVLLDDESRTLKNFSALKSLTIRWGVVVPRTENSPTNAQGRKLQRIQTLGKSSLSLPPKLEKLDLRCFPGKEFLDCISPEKLVSLKKLYIRGGELCKLCNEIEGKVEVLRLKCLKHLVLDWEELQRSFPDVSCVEIHKCDNITSFQGDEDGFWTREIPADRQGAE